MKHELNLEFMDLPPPSQLAACNTLHCDIMLRAPPGLVIILDYPHGRIDTIDLEGYIRLVHYRRIKPPRIMRIAILLQSEYDAIHRPLRLIYNRSSERLEQYYINQPIIWERQSKTMTKTSNKNVVARKAAPKKVTAKTSVDHIETPTAKVATTTETPAEEATEKLAATPPKKAPAICKIKLSREDILKLVYDKPFTPIEWSEIELVVAPEYMDVFKLAKSEEKMDNPPRRTIQVIPNLRFLKAYMKANGANRARKLSHVELLANTFRKNFEPSCTHYVLTLDRAVANAGHSCMAMAMGLFNVTDEDGELFVGVSSDFEWIDGPEAEANALANLGDNLRCTLVLNAPANAVLKMDDVRLEASDENYLEMIPAICRMIEDYNVSAKLLAQVSNGLWKRTSYPTDVVDPNNDKKTVKKYGTVSIGGRLNKEESPVRVITFGPMILAGLIDLREACGDSITFYNGLATPTLTLKDVLVAMALLDDSQRKRLAEALGKHSTFAENLSQKLTKPAQSQGWRKPSADWIITCLIKYGMSGTAGLPTTLLDRSWHDPKFRSSNWDIGGVDDNEETREEVFLRSAKTIANIVGNVGLITSSNKKAEREATAAKKGSAKKGKTVNAE